MLFNIEEAGQRIAGWLVADNSAVESALIIVLDGGRRRLRLVANTYRPDLRELGLHPTGYCGFIIDALTCPEVTPEAKVEVFDEGSNTLIFRRTLDAPSTMRLFNLETQTFPAYNLARHLSPQLEMIYSNAEMVGEETNTHLLHLAFESILISGTLLYRLYEPMMKTREFRRCILLCEPRREIAARLLRAKTLAAEGGPPDGWKTLGQRRLIDAVGDADLTDAASLGRALKRLSDSDFFALANPTIRKLVAKTHDAGLDKHHVGLALDSLAEFDVVGFGDRISVYAEGLEALLGCEGLPRGADEDPPEMKAILAALASCRPAAELVNLDTALYDLASAAFEKANAEAAA